MGILWTIIIGFVAGVIAKFIMPGSNEPSGFILTTILGIVGAFVASYRAHRRRRRRKYRSLCLGTHRQAQDVGNQRILHRATIVEANDDTFPGKPRSR